mmetsp:Transcript_17174/g.27445  ORF Transcript_17174/g.27445 Transcript_17174/m.27445 type:complete len:289 (+) Transcript_17174:696-1562(+)
MKKASASFPCLMQNGKWILISLRCVGTTRVFMIGWIQDITLQLSQVQKIVQERTNSSRQEGRSSRIADPNRTRANAHATSTSAQEWVPHRDRNVQGGVVPNLKEGFVPRINSRGAESFDRTFSHSNRRIESHEELLPHEEFGHRRKQIRSIMLEDKFATNSAKMKNLDSFSGSNAVARASWVRNLVKSEQRGLPRRKIYSESPPHLRYPEAAGRPSLLHQSQLEGTTESRRLIGYGVSSASSSRKKELQTSQSAPQQVHMGLSRIANESQVGSASQKDTGISAKQRKI